VDSREDTGCVCRIPRGRAIISLRLTVSIHLTLFGYYYSKYVQACSFGHVTLMTFWSTGFKPISLLSGGDLSCTFRYGVAWLWRSRRLRSRGDSSCSHSRGHDCKYAPHGKETVGFTNVATASCIPAISVRVEVLRLKSSLCGMIGVVSAGAR
jgi:hypothetical protein